MILRTISRPMIKSLLDLKTIALLPECTGALITLSIVFLIPWLLRKRRAPLKFGLHFRLGSSTSALTSALSISSATSYTAIMSNPGAMLSPCRVPLSCLIEISSLSIFSATSNSPCDFFTRHVHLSGAPIFLSATEIASCFVLSYALTRSMSIARESIP